MRLTRYETEASVTDKVVVEGDEGSWFRMKNAEEVVGLAGEGRIRHGRER